MNHIELFAGCGGLSLGLESAGFQTLMANELSPMAAETFAYNFFQEDLSTIADAAESRVLWISSSHQQVKDRLRENPFNYPDIGMGFGELKADGSNAKGCLLVGNIVHLNKLVEQSNEFQDLIKNGFGEGSVDLVSGGPPCQSFSLAGLRKKDCEKNSLPWEFAKFVNNTRPKAVLLENVSGILRPFTEGGVEYHAWFEVAKAFSEIGYLPLCLHLNARYVGVPQNRPRFIMLGLREDVYLSLEPLLSEYEIGLFRYALDLSKATKELKDFSHLDFGYFDFSDGYFPKEMQSTFLKYLTPIDEVSVFQAIDDLRFSSGSKPSKYVKNLNRFFDVAAKKVVDNHAPRANSDLVKRRFRLYQVLQGCDKSLVKEVNSVLVGSSANLSDEAWDVIKNDNFLMEDGSYSRFKSKKLFLEFLCNHSTKKQTQRALNPNQPAPAALSIPDDFCHYAEDELRTLTVREMARIQSFPDGFVFRSKITTGGLSRRFEVPQYTQVGNAVPPLLAYRLGLIVKDLLERI